jgi:uncharacterized membrane protein YeaQ/YmgE (transglycosylase-associated protein family)
MAKEPDHVRQKLKGDNRVKYFYPAIISLAGPLMAVPAFAQDANGTIPEGAGIIAWIVVGLIGGFLASRVVNKTGEGIVRDIILGIIGGIIGGIIFRAFGGYGVTGVNLWSILVAFVGGIVVLLIYHAFRGQRVEPRGSV